MKRHEAILFKQFFLYINLLSNLLKLYLSDILILLPYSLNQSTAQGQRACLCNGRTTWSLVCLHCVFVKLFCQPLPWFRWFKHHEIQDNVLQSVVPNTSQWVLFTVEFEEHNHRTCVCVEDVVKSLVQLISWGEINSFRDLRQ